MVDRLFPAGLELEIRLEREIVTKRGPFCSLPARYRQGIN